MLEYIEVGHGETKEQCGTEKGWIVCDNGHKSKRMNYCFRSICPKCWEVWLRRENERITKRFAFVQTSKRMEMEHIIASFPYLPQNKKDYASMRAKAIRSLRSLGISGGLLVPHLKERKGGIGLTLHFHITGLGHLELSGVRTNYVKTAIVIKRIRKVVKPGNLNDYELDHAVKFEGANIVSWFGIMTSHYLGKETRVEKEQGRCHCGALQWAEINEAACDELPHLCEHLVFIEYVTYFWKDKLEKPKTLYDY